MASVHILVIERRREQNARAQQRSRARRRTLEKALKEDHSISCHDCSPIIRSNGCRGKTQCLQPKKCGEHPGTEKLDIGAILKYGLISMWYCLDSMFESRRSLCFAWCSTVLLAGVQVFSRIKGSASWRFRVSSPSVLALGGGISQWNTHISAFIAIARHIGLSFDRIADDDAVSLFTSPYPPDPFRSFRSRALAMIAHGGQDLDEYALCFDLMHGGRQCHGSSQISLHGRRDGAPWDAGSWEAAPWFLRNGAALVGDENDLIYQNSAWWWA
ncbi:hypothetical protein BDV12DRAFT_190772 [Aspergillus spectabilis]